MNMTKIVFCWFAGVVLAISGLARARFNVRFIDQLPPGRHPQIVYWFWQTNILANQQYLRDVRNMATNSPYTFAFYTARDGLNFYDFAKMHEPFAQAVREAHKLHLKIELQLLDYGNPFGAPHQEPVSPT